MAHDGTKCNCIEMPQGDGEGARVNNRKFLPLLAF